SSANVPTNTSPARLPISSSCPTTCSMRRGRTAPILSRGSPHSRPRAVEQLLEDGQASKADIYRHLTQNLRRDLIVPVFLGAAGQDNGVRRLLKALRHETPDATTTASRLKLDPKAADTIANVIKAYHPPNAGKLSLVRVW